jgi:alkylation response protein AidB-like acyl-CoA dehydrogenase
VTPAVVRALWEDPRGERDDLWKEMARLGWLGLALPEEHGGSALGMVETAVVLEELGRCVPGTVPRDRGGGTGHQRVGALAQQARAGCRPSPGAARDRRALDAELD